MKEKSILSLSKSVYFEKTGETISIQISVEDVSPARLNLIRGTADVLYEELIKNFSDYCIYQ